MLNSHEQKNRKNNPFNILSSIATWMSFKRAIFNPAEMLIKIGNQTGAVVYDTTVNKRMADYARGRRFVCKVNSTLLGFEDDEHTVWIPTDHPAEVTAADIAQAWQECIRLVWLEAASHGDDWQMPLEVKIQHGSIYLAGIRIGHWWMDGRARLFTYDDDSIVIENATIPGILLSLKRLYSPDYEV